MSADPARAPAGPRIWDQLVAESGLPRLDARALLEHLTGQRREWFMAHGDRAVPPAIAQAFRSLAARRQAGEPLAYVLGWREFYGRRFAVTPAVLVPRPETEHLVAAALEHLPAAPQAARVLELGTGSGAIAITLALLRPDLTIVATDISAAALALAERNARTLGAHALTFRQGDWWQALDPKTPGFELIVANPPYIAATDPHLADPALRHEPQGALASGPTGLDALTHLTAGARRFLTPGGWLLLEHGHDQGAAVRALLNAAGLGPPRTLTDWAGHERISLAQHPPTPS